MNLIVVNLIKEYLPYLIAFLLGVVVAWKGCGNTSGKPVTTVIEKPVPVIEYVDRWKYDTLRFARWNTVYDTIHDTVHDVEYVNIYDSVLVIDTIKIIESWLTEVTKYDTTASFETADVRLRWQNYQNVSENLVINYLPKKVPLTWSLGMHGIAGLQSDFNRSYKPLFGLGLHTTIKNTYISGSYGYNSDHFIMVGVGRNFINR